jgi:hypothetical protein
MARRTIRRGPTTLESFISDLPKLLLQWHGMQERTRIYKEELKTQEDMKVAQLGLNNLGQLIKNSQSDIDTYEDAIDALDTELATTTSFMPDYEDVQGTYGNEANEILSSITQHYKGPLLSGIQTQVDLAGNIMNKAADLKAEYEAKKADSLTLRRMATQFTGAQQDIRKLTGDQYMVDPEDMIQYFDQMTATGFFDPGTSAEDMTKYRGLWEGMALSETDAMAQALKVKEYEMGQAQTSEQYTQYVFDNWDQLSFKDKDDAITYQTKVIGYNIESIVSQLETNLTFVLPHVQEYQALIADGKSDTNTKVKQAKAKIDAAYADIGQRISGVNPLNYSQYGDIEGAPITGVDRSHTKYSENPNKQNDLLVGYFQSYNMEVGEQAVTALLAFIRKDNADDVEFRKLLENFMLSVDQIPVIETKNGKAVDNGLGGFNLGFRDRNAIKDQNGNVVPLYDIHPETGEPLAPGALIKNPRSTGIADPERTVNGMEYDVHGVPLAIKNVQKDYDSINLYDVTGLEFEDFLEGGRISKILDAFIMKETMTENLLLDTFKDPNEMKILEQKRIIESEQGQKISNEGDNPDTSMIFDSPKLYDIFGEDENTQDILAILDGFDGTESNRHLTQFTGTKPPRFTNLDSPYQVNPNLFNFSQKAGVENKVVRGENKFDRAIEDAIASEDNFWIV